MAQRRRTTSANRPRPGGRVRTAAAARTVKRPTPRRGVLPFKYSVIRIFALSSVSMFYPLYWFYVSRRNASTELGTTDQTGLQTLGLLVPVLNLFIVYWLCRDVAKLRAQAGLPAFSAKTYVLAPLLAALGSALLFILSATLGHGIPATILVLLGLLTTFAWIILTYVLWGMVIHKFNQYWEARGAAAEASFSDGETVVLIVGMLAPLVLFFVFGFISALSNPSFGDYPSGRMEQDGPSGSGNSADYL